MASRFTRITRTITRHVTPTGRALVALSGLGLVAGQRLGWVEFRVLGLACVALLVIAGALVLLPRRAHVGLELPRTRVMVRDEAHVVLSVRPGLLPMLNPVIQLIVGRRLMTYRLPVLWPGRTYRQRHEIPTSRRGIYDVGPVINLQSDPLGAFTRRRTWAAPAEIYVRPRLVSLGSLTTGVIADLEGVASNELSPGDLAFHALREYAPGDDLRHVHWRSSAKAQQLLVRQYQETRRANATILLDLSPGAYAVAHHLELAVSVASSIAVRALADDFEVTMGAGSVLSRVASIDALLDEACSWHLEMGDIGEQARRAAHANPGVSLVVVVSGGLLDPLAARAVTSHFPASAQQLIVRAVPKAASGIREVGRVHDLTCGRLEHLPVLLGGGLQ